MSFQVADQVYLSMTINGQDVPIAEQSFEKLEMIENVQNKLPTIEFVYNDMMNFMEGTAYCVGGSIVEVTFAKDPNNDANVASVPYIVTGTNVQIMGNKLIWVVSGVYNAPQYLSGQVSQKSYKGTSGDVVSQLASQVGLQISTISTNDSQVWLSNREAYSDFVASIVDHGYVDSNSITSHAVNDSGLLTYINLTTLATASPNATIVSGVPGSFSDGTIPMIGYEIMSLDGIYNFMYNYGTKLVQEKLSGDAQIFSGYDATQFSQFLSLSSAIQSTLGSGGVRSEYLPHQTGNQHDKYFDAEYQNRRGRQLFNCIIKPTIAQASGINLYDVVSVNPIIPVTNELSTLWTGNYICSAKVKYLQRMNYMERLELLSQGFGTNPGFLVSA